MDWVKNKSTNVINGYSWGTPEHTKYIKQACKDIQDNLKELGLFDKIYSYWMDEPSESEYDYVVKVNDLIHTAAPNLKILLTEQVEDKLIGHVDAWCPHLYHYNKEKCDERIK